MNYQKIYDDLMETRRTKNLDTKEYCEKHHIIPRCLGGTNSNENLIMLTYREHFIAHWLLCRINISHSGIQYAFLCMLRKQPTGERILNSRMFSTIKKNFSKYKKFHCKLENPGKSQKSRDAARKRMLENNPTKLNPAGNRTAQPIRIYFEDGRIEEYRYAKEYCLKSGVPYATMKYWLRNDIKSKKHKIMKREKL